MNTPRRFTRRDFSLLAAASLFSPSTATANASRVIELSWEDLIPPDTPYAKIIAKGEVDEVNDTWQPIFDENARKLNTELQGSSVKLPGYVIPLEVDYRGVSSFILVPFVGACIHVPPPPPNQLVFVETNTPWPNDSLWSAVWVSGQLSIETQVTELAEIGYAINAASVEMYTNIARKKRFSRSPFNPFDW